MFIAATMDDLLRAFDAKTGRELWAGELPHGGQATPMTYAIGGRQYVVVAAGGHPSLGNEIGESLVALGVWVTEPVCLINNEDASRFSDPAREPGATAQCLVSQNLRTGLLLLQQPAPLRHETTNSGALGLSMATPRRNVSSSKSKTWSKSALLSTTASAAANMPGYL